MSAYQSFSVPAVWKIYDKLKEISDSGLLDNWWVPQTGKGVVAIPELAAELLTQIKDVQLVNELLDVPEARVLISKGNNFYLIVEILKKYKEVLNDKNS